MTLAPPRIGAYINNRAAVFSADDYSLADLLHLAVDAEAAGLDFVSVGDSVLAKPRWSAVVVLAAVAAATDRIGLSTGILQPHLRHPILLAQEWLTLDAISQGRTTLAVGLGTGPPDLVDTELALVGLHRRNRARAFEEAIEVIKLVWQNERATFDGKIYQLDDTEIGLRPLNPGGPPLMIAAGAYIPKQEGFGPNDVFSAETADSFIGPWHRVARLGDGWMTGMATPTEVETTWASIEAAAAEIGRELPRDFDRRLNLFINVSDDAEAARAEGKDFLEAYHRRPMDQDSLDRWLICGTPNECADRLSEYVEAGITSFQCVLGSVHQRHQLELLATAVAPLLR
jgi:alkanesulfonate monooxygenase SsuD/methylene tetrahydromethanopterin reductase-like flavin-dependent oxidoreductase (luciferase family)